MSKSERTKFRKKHFKLVYFGKNSTDMEQANVEFWKQASPESKHQAMREFVADELKRLGLAEHGSKLLRLSSTFRRA